MNRMIFRPARAKEEAQAGFVDGQKVRIKVTVRYDVSYCPVVAGHSHPILRAYRSAQSSILDPAPDWQIPA